MALWRNIRRLSFSGALQGAKEPGELDIITPAQAVQVVDDASRAVAPVSVPQALVNVTNVPALLEHSGIELQPRAGGLWLVVAGGGLFASATDFWRDDDQVTAARAPGNIQSWGVPNGQAIESGVFAVQIAAAARPADRVGLGAFAQGEAFPPAPVYLEPGVRVFFVNAAVNDALTQWFGVREVPHRQRLDTA